MRKTWPFLVPVVVIGALAGAGIAGRPSSPDSFVIDPSSITDPPSATEPTFPDLATTTSDETASEPATTDAEIPTSTSEADSTTSTSEDVATTTSTTSTSSSTTTTLADETVPKDELKLVIANGDGRFNLAGRNADRLRAAGYVIIDVTDVSDRSLLTTLYYRDDFEDEARTLAADLLVPAAILEPLPADPITVDDAAGDVIVVLGGDAIR